MIMMIAASRSQSILQCKIESQFSLQLRVMPGIAHLGKHVYADDCLYVGSEGMHHINK